MSTIEYGPRPMTVEAKTVFNVPWQWNYRPCRVSAIHIYTILLEKLSSDIISDSGCFSVNIF